MQKKIYYVLIILVLGFLINEYPLSAQGTATGQTENKAPSKSGFERVDKVISRLVENERIIGCTALVFHNGKELYYRDWGQRDRENELPITRDTIFRIYSMTKPVTSIAAMQLVEAGKLELDAPLSKYLPEFANRKVLYAVADKDGKQVFAEIAAKREITPRDLLRHTSGLTYGFFSDTEVDRKYRKAGVLVTEPTIEGTVTKLGKIPLLHHPGTQFVYSVSTDVLGRLIEVVSEQKFDEYLNKNIFEPLQMKDTFFTVPTEKMERFAQLYQPDASRKLKPASPWESFRFRNQKNKFFSGGGGLCSTTDDYLKFCQVLLNGGTFKGKQIITEKSLEQMFTNQLADIAQPPSQFKFGLGFAISDRGDYSWGGAAGTRFWVNPERKLAVIYMVQNKPANGPDQGAFIRDVAYSVVDSDR